MPRKATTFRLEPAEQEALSRISVLLRRPMNKLVNEAVRAYLQRRSSELLQELQGTIAALQTYRSQDPDFERVIDDFVNAEAEAGFDPAEGARKESASPVRAEIRRLLNA
jgi:hypothetical protein